MPDADIETGLRLDAERTDPEFGKTRPLRYYPDEPGAKIWYDDGDLCADVYHNMGIGVDGNVMAKFLTHAANHYADALREVKRLTAENERLRNEIDDLKEQHKYDMMERQEYDD